MLFRRGLNLHLGTKMSPKLSLALIKGVPILSPQPVAGRAGKRSASRLLYPWHIIKNISHGKILAI
jgi:hypothetical protein